MEKIHITVVGAGVVGLAIACELSKTYKDIIIIEKNPSFGRETSSRNSEVIHVGIYYPKDSLKTKTCIEGSRLLYEYCKRNNISNRKIGKLIVAIDNSEVKDLEILYKHGLSNGVEDLKFLSKEEVWKIEPNIRAEAAILSSNTGILDTHSFMEALVFEFKSRGGQIAYNCELIGLDKNEHGYKLSIKENDGSEFNFATRVFINCAGLYSDKIAGMCGLKMDEYKLKYCKGDYFRASNEKSKYINRLVYPVPKNDRAGLGIHATLDLAGGLRLGPDDEYVENLGYNIDEAKREIFYESVKNFLPFITLKDLSIDTSGIRPKLQGPGEGFRDFLIKDEAVNGLPAVVNLIGIESPGLTATLSIAIIVKKIVRNYAQS